MLNKQCFAALSFVWIMALASISGSANADMILVELYIGNDGINLDGTEQLDGVLLIDVTDNGRVDWIFDADGDPLNGNQLLNPQTSGGLTITGGTFKPDPDSTEALTGTWDWDNSFGTLDYLSFKFDSWVAVYQITNGDITGSWDLEALCYDEGACNNGGQPAALSHSVGYSVVPVPAAVWLFGSGLLGLVGLARRKPA
jgi:hypothetical protein